MNIFLSGKVDATYGAWRDHLLGTDWEWRDGVSRRQSRWMLECDMRDEDYGTDAPPPPWPRGPNRWVLGLHDYVGPYRISLPSEASNKGSGTFHGVEWVGQHGWPDEGWRSEIAARCCVALHQADLVFAYINRPDCYGTLVEIGYARALGKFVYVAIEPEANWEHEDYWFVDTMASGAADLAERYPEEPVPAPEDHIRHLFQQALVAWTASVRVETRAAPLPPGIAQSFGQIAQWTSDPRVRGEARRILRALSDGKEPR